MATPHTHHLHLPKGPNLFVIAISGLGCSVLSLFFFVIAWMTAGTAYIREFGGMNTLAVLLVCILFFTAISIAERQKS